MSEFLYHYRVRVLKVIDGDTFEADIDLGFGAWIHGKRIRVLGCDAFEMKDSKGPDAKNFTSNALISDDVVIRSMGKQFDNFGRVLARVYIKGRDLADMLIEAGHAVEYRG